MFEYSISIHTNLKHHIFIKLFLLLLFFILVFEQFSVSIIFYNLTSLSCSRLVEPTVTNWSIFIMLNDLLLVNEQI